MSNDIEIYRRQGFAGQVGLGQRPSLVVVDFVVGFTDPEHFGGGNISEAVANTVGLLGFARAQGWPVAFTRIVYADDGADAGAFAAKVPTLLKLTEASPLSQVVPELEPVPGELVIRKRQASAFFATELAGWLTYRGVDTVVLVGCTTSGCIRASAIDAVSHNFRTILVSDCVGDRALKPHEANLFDIGQKYADLMTADELIAHYRAAVPAQ